MKTFYSCIDSTLLVPQPVQHLVIRDYAAKAGGSVVFYGAEELKTLKSQAFLRAKLKRTPGLQGVILFTFHQFRYGDEPNFALLRDILRSGLEVHLAREGLSFRSEEEFEKMLPFLLSVDFTLRRDASIDWKVFLASAELEAYALCRGLEER